MIWNYVLYNVFIVLFVLSFFFCFCFFFGSLNHLHTACESLLALAHRRRNHLQSVRASLRSARAHNLQPLQLPAAAERSPTLAAGRVAPGREFPSSPDPEATPVRPAQRTHTAQIPHEKHMKLQFVCVFLGFCLWRIAPPNPPISRTDALLTSPSADSLWLTFLLLSGPYRWCVILKQKVASAWSLATVFFLKTKKRLVSRRVLNVRHDHVYMNVKKKKTGVKLEFGQWEEASFCFYEPNKIGWIFTVTVCVSQSAAGFHPNCSHFSPCWDLVCCFVCLFFVFCYFFLVCFVSFIDIDLIWLLYWI